MYGEQFSPTWRFDSHVDGNYLLGALNWLVGEMLGVRRHVRHVGRQPYGSSRMAELNVSGDGPAVAVA